MPGYRFIKATTPTLIILNGFCSHGRFRHGSCVGLDDINQQTPGPQSSQKIEHYLDNGVLTNLTLGLRVDAVFLCPGIITVE